MLTCQEATRLLSESMDHPLPWRRRWSLWLHVLMCRYCSQFAQHLIRLRTICRQHGEGVGEDLDSQGLSSEVRQRIKKRICDEKDNLGKGSQ